MLQYGLLSLAVLALLTACQNEAKDEAYYINHPAELAKALHACERNKTMTCSLAYSAQKRMRATVADLRSKPENFGLRIMQDQRELRLLQEELNKNPKQDQLKRRMHELQLDLKARLSVLYMMSEKH